MTDSKKHTATNDPVSSHRPGHHIRVGHGYDVHRFAHASNSPEANSTQDKPLILASVEIPGELSLLAHSDGDVILHALCDAILGAIGKGDIGRHFPDNDKRFKGIASSELLRQVLVMATNERWFVGNVDITVVCQVPRLAPYRDAMVKALVQLLDVPDGAVNVKATTTEHLGFEGRGEGMACHAVVLMQHG